MICTSLDIELYKFFTILNIHTSPHRVSRTPIRGYKSISEFFDLFLSFSKTTLFKYKGIISSYTSYILNLYTFLPILTRQSLINNPSIYTFFINLLNFWHFELIQSKRNIKIVIKMDIIAYNSHNIYVLVSYKVNYINYII